MKDKGRIPVRSGKYYGSPKCCGARYCTWDAYQKAKRDADILAKHMGKGWMPNVTENLGWHWEVVSPCKRIRIDRGYLGMGDEYDATLHQPKDVLILYSAQASTPEEAMKKLIEIAKKDLSRKLRETEILLRGM